MRASALCAQVEEEEEEVVEEEDDHSSHAAKLEAAREWIENLPPGVQQRIQNQVTAVSVRASERTSGWMGGRVGMWRVSE
jgi:hypothetical protein